MSANALRQLPRVLAATFAVVLIPLLLVKGAAAVTGLTSPLLSVAAVVALSFAVANAGAAYWSRRPGSRDMVFGDLMLWGWLRRMRTERRLAEVCRLLGLGRSGHSVLDTKLSQAQQTKLLECLGSSLEALDPHTHGHTQRVTRHAAMIARRMGLSEDEVAKVRTGAALHDVGKLDTPRNVLNKPDKLTDEEFAIMRRHTVDGAEILRRTPEMPILAPVVAFEHHLRIDGTGYPFEAKRGTLNLGTMLCGIADVYDAMRTQRAYQQAFPTDRILAVLQRNDGTQFDRHLVRRFVQLLGIYPAGNLVKLNSGEIAVVTQPHAPDPYRPRVKVLVNRDGARLDLPYERNLWESPHEGAPPDSIVSPVDPAEVGIDPLNHLEVGGN